MVNVTHCPLLSNPRPSALTVDVSLHHTSAKRSVRIALIRNGVRLKSMIKAVSFIEEQDRRIRPTSSAEKWSRTRRVGPAFLAVTAGVGSVMRV